MDKEIFIIKKKACIAWISLPLTFFLALFIFDSSQNFDSSQHFVIQIFILVPYLIFKTDSILLLSRHSQDKKIVVYFFIYYLLYLCFVLLGVIFDDYNFNNPKYTQIVYLWLCVLSIASYFYSRQLYITTEEKFFLYAFFFEIFTFIERITDIFGGYSNLLLCITILLNVIAWIKFKTIKVKEN